ncbi:hypothetical protein LTR08_004098 [Meristemomyces frigidus]|nr:hypothetical protein LTR08_004098 [Meristemomyces frigidus]
MQRRQQSTAQYSPPLQRSSQLTRSPTGGYGADAEPDPHNPFMDPRHRSPDRYNPPPAHYQLDDRPYAHPDHDVENEPLEIPVGPGPGQHQQQPLYGASADRLQAQPTYSVENMPGTYGHSEAYEDVHEHAYTPNPFQQQPHLGTGDYALSPLHDGRAEGGYGYGEGGLPGQEGAYDQLQHPYYQDVDDSRPILQAGGTSYGPDPHSMQEPGDVDPSHANIEARYADPPPPAATSTIRRWKTVKEVQLFNGNLVLDCPVPPRLLNQVQHAQPPERDEFTHMRYSAATCDPADFNSKRFTLRQRLFAKPRHTELFIVVTMYNEEDELLARTLIGVFKNIEFMNSRTSSKTWGKEAWKKIVVCIVSDGRAKINPRTRSVLAAMGVYQDGIAKQQVNGEDVTAHIYEYTTQMALEIKKGVVGVKRGNTPVQILFCLKEKNQKKINSHRWFFQAFGSVLDPNICVLLDAGTRPGRSSIYDLWKAFDREPMCAGACGEIKAMLMKGRNLINPLVAAQNFEYKMSNILDKPLESAFGFISVLPGAFSAYIALQNDKAGAGPLEQYFKGEKMHGANAGIFTANMYLAEDRILCFELVSKRGCSWILQYVKSATGETDVPTEMADFILQRRRWLNGSFFAAVYALAHFYQIGRSHHSGVRKFMFMLEFVYQAVNMLFAWFAIGNFFLVFRILTTSLSDDDLLGTAGYVLSVVFEWLYLATLVTCFVLALGNRPQGSNKFYMTQVYFWALLMTYLLFASVFITVKSVQAQIKLHNGFSLAMLFTNHLFFTLIVSMCSTWLLWLFASILFLDPWHMATSFIQYLLLTPTYINILNVYAFCNTHDITWGTKGDDKAEALPAANVTGAAGKVAVALPADDADLNTQYETELRAFSTRYAPPKKAVNEQEKHEDYYKGFRSAVVLAWMFCNLGLAAIVLDLGGVEKVSGTSTDTESERRSTIYMGVVLYSVAVLAAIRFVGACWFLVARMFRGV